MLASYFNKGPYPCEVGHYYFPVDRGSGHLGSLRNLAESGSCSGPFAVAVSDQAAGGAGGPCGQACGSVGVTQVATGNIIDCTASMLTFCSDDVAWDGVYFDRRNVFFADTDTREIYIADLNFTNATITQSDSAIPGNPKLYFSPDSMLVYALYGRNIGVYAFDPAP